MFAEVAGVHKVSVELAVLLCMVKPELQLLPPGGIQCAGQVLMNEYENMFFFCVFTVSTVRFNFAAISLFDFPSKWRRKI